MYRAAFLYQRFCFAPSFCLDSLRIYKPTPLNYETTSAFINGFFFFPVVVCTKE